MNPNKWTFWVIFRNSNTYEVYGEAETIEQYNAVMKDINENDDIKVVDVRPFKFTL